MFLTPEYILQDMPIDFFDFQFTMNADGTVSDANGKLLDGNKLTMYDKKLNQQIADTLKRYNAKIDRLARARSNFMLPQKVTKEDLMEVSYTRRDLQRRLSNLERFTKRGAEKTVMTSSG